MLQRIRRGHIFLTFNGQNYLVSRARPINQPINESVSVILAISGFDPPDQGGTWATICSGSDRVWVVLDSMELDMTPQVV